MATETTLQKEIRILNNRINTFNSMKSNMDKTLGYIARSMQENLDTCTEEYKNDPQNKVHIAKQKTYISGFYALMNDFDSLVSGYKEEKKIKETQSITTTIPGVDSGG